MDLVGCGCMGFSFTHKYKKAIISFFEFVTELDNVGVLSYQDLQTRIANKGISDESEIRMIVPFLVKSQIINEKNCLKTSTGTRIRQLVIDEHFFTEQGIEFIKILKMEINKDISLNKEIIFRIENLYHKAGMVLFLSLCKSDDYIYRELFFFLKKYKSIDKNEFYILTNSIEKSKKNELEENILKYRNGSIGELKIIRNVNDWQYLTGTLQQFGIIEEDENKSFILTNDADELEVENNE